MISSLVTSIAADDVAAASVALYLLPALIAWARRLPALARVVTVDVLAGWTLIGWAIALALALGPPRGHAAAGEPAAAQPPEPAPPPHRAGWGGPPGPPPARSTPAPPLILPRRPTGTAPASQAERP